ncbi:cytochrome P450 [Streptomyces sp. NBC_01518]
MESIVASSNVDRRALVSLFARLRRSEGQSNPLPIYDQLRSLGEVIPAPWGGHLVTSYRLCHSILRDKSWRVPDRQWRASQTGSNRWNSAASFQMASTLPMLNPPLHTQTREILGRVFHKGLLPQLSSSVQKTVDRLLDQFFEELSQGPADFVKSVGEELPVIAIGEWLGLPSSDYGLLRTLTHDQVFTQELFPSATELSLSDAATAQLRSYFSALINDRRENPGTDPISNWLRIWDERERDRATVDEAVHSIALFMILAALETTSHVLSATLRLVLSHREQEDWLRQLPHLVPDAVEEALRYDPPIHMISRIAGTTTDLGGIRVPAGGMVQLMVGAAHHDPAQWTDAHHFDVRRRQTKTAGPPHLSFGAGIHYCLGSQLARLEATVLLESLLKRPGRLRINAPVQWASRIAFRRTTSLELVLE